MATVARLAVSRLLCSRSALVPKLKKPLTRSNTDATWQQHGVPGANLPFDIRNRYKLTALFALVSGIGFNLPFVVVIHQYVKK